MDSGAGVGGIGDGDGSSHRSDGAIEMALEYRGTGKVAGQLLRGALALSHRTNFLVHVWLADTPGNLALKVFPKAVARGSNPDFDTGDCIGSV